MLVQSMNNQRSMNSPLCETNSKVSSAPDLATSNGVIQMSSGGVAELSRCSPAHSSQPAHLDELHAESCSQLVQKNTSIVTADINPVSASTYNDTHQMLIVNPTGSSGAESKTGAGPHSCQSRHSESNDSGFSSDRKHSHGNDAGYHSAASASCNHGNWDKPRNQLQKKSSDSSLYCSSVGGAESAVSTSEIALQNHVTLAWADNDDCCLTPVSEV